MTAREDTREFSGIVATGLGAASRFTNVEWVEASLRQHFGIPPWPGTLNLTLEAQSKNLVDAWLDSDEAVTLHAPQSDSSGEAAAHCIAVRLATQGQGEPPVPGVIIRPNVDDYPSDKLEIVSAVQLRDTLSVADQTKVTVTRAPRYDVDAVVFDLDGTLVDSLEAYFQVALEAARSQGEEVTRDFVRGTLDANNHAFWELVFAEDDPQRDERITAVKFVARERWPEIQSEYVRAIEGAAATVQALHDRGLKLGIVTAGSGTTITPLSDAGVHGLFDTVVTRVDVAQPKPDPQGLALALKNLGVAPERAMYVGDSRVDVLTAHNAGTASLGVLSGAGTAASLTSVRPTRLAPTIEALKTLIR